MATYSFHRLIMGKVEIGNFYCLIGDNRILFLQKCLLNSSSHFIRLLSELLNLIGCWGNIKSLIFEKNLFLKNHRGRTGLVVRASDSGSGDPGSILGRVGVLFP